jgi:transketolase N-terminal domain/subunit
VAQSLNVKLIIDDNDVTIAGFPSDYMKGFDVAKTLGGHSVPCHEVVGEDIDALYVLLIESHSKGTPFHNHVTASSIMQRRDSITQHSFP